MPFGVELRIYLSVTQKGKCGVGTDHGVGLRRVPVTACAGSHSAMIHALLAPALYAIQALHLVVASA